MNITELIRRRHRALAGRPLNSSKQTELRKNYKIQTSNLLSTFVILVNKEAAVILIATGLATACVCAISSGASETFKTVYSFNEIHTALMFIPIGVITIIS